jgi:hypothetical protein
MLGALVMLQTFVMLSAAKHLDAQRGRPFALLGDLLNLEQFTALNS